MQFFEDKARLSIASFVGFIRLAGCCFSLTDRLKQDGTFRIKCTTNVY